MNMMVVLDAVTLLNPDGIALMVEKIIAGALPLELASDDCDTPAAAAALANAQSSAGLEVQRPDSRCRAVERLPGGASLPVDGRVANRRGA